MYTDLIDKAPIGSWAWGILVPAVSALLCAGLIALLRPLFARYALARPNARSSHTVPTQQGGGIPVIVATIIVSYGALQFAPFGATAITLQLPIVCIAMLLIACVGVLADIHPANFIPRLLLQTLAVAAVIFVMPPQLRVLPVVPLPLERAALVVGGLWFVNLVNFMDGLDWMMVAETVPISSALAVIGWLGMLPPAALVLSLALCGAMIGFAFFNRPVARTLSWRRRQPARRAPPRLAPRFAGRKWRLRGGNSTAPLLSCRFIHHASPTCNQGRKDMARAPLAFLPARHRPRLFRARRRSTSLCCQPRASSPRVGDRIISLPSNQYCSAFLWRRTGELAACCLRA